ncbi:hypothetical protein LTR10_018987 [Elasticomyces elasticus]|uniref:Elongation of fatty acids protein n=1 Tax=Exophiala sideris TaxID=1016849 RepID=A0ABR0IXU4_9EURO|nr:hypothetical protein LTR10_018987 [Elasticomyces elasticus]KAK5022259.1 hypothetical protein LTS07_010135 [Exophiala sideris]KAK5027071.1 hypothetical protein LTR13_009681 [Exophiala sideris]KAK5051646.1 hypothetical protein LTR69_010146 [Exophiala sideris]KAK5177611.1 hypothetical protein LTR44_009801 [Eurotiomycetes sp. CCFEE 6388]
MSGTVTDLIDWLGLSQTAPRVKITPPPASFFKFPPSSAPTTLPPPPNHPSFAHPFTVPTDIYNATLSPHVPITVALLYMSFVVFMNSANANRKYKPWAISRTRIFKLLVILHNTFLAAYSAWTFLGMLNALRLTLPKWSEETTVAETVDALCKLHGPRGVGNAATYNVTQSAWTMTNRLFHLAADGLGPDTADVGRIWNEGLAFYGWLFYLSKFYEVIDTLIILSKGRRSSLLQTYHHAGAMLCMWAGIRYMSPPIWMFVLVNSGIHAIMYTFYLLSALGIRVPTWFKRTLTTLQISQFVIGAAYAFIHLFIAYQVPVSVPYIYHLGSVASKVATGVTSDISATASSAIATASAGVGSWLKKAALRAAGYEGLAENVLNEQGQTFGIDAVHAAEDLVAREETRYRDEVQYVHCLDTSGQVFAILLNCMYLLPLTWLFAQFFITSYIKRTERRRSSTASEKAYAARQSLQDASKGLARRLSEALEEMHQVTDDLGEENALVDEDEVKAELRDLANQAKSTYEKGVNKAKETMSKVDTGKVKDQFQRDLQAIKENLQDTAEKASNAIKSKTGSLDEVKENVAQTVNKTVDAAKQAGSKASETAQETADDIKKSSGKAKKKAAAEAKKTSEQAKDKAAEAPEDVKKSTEKAKGKAAEGADKASKKVDEAADEKQSPNGNGTGGGEASSTNGSEETAKVEEGKSFADAVKEEDESSEVQDGKSFADAVKE